MLYCKPISWGRCWLMFLTTETAVAPGTSRTCSSLAPNGISQSTTPRTPFFLPRFQCQGGRAWKAPR